MISLLRFNSLAFYVQLEFPILRPFPLSWSNRNNRLECFAKKISKRTLYFLLCEITIFCTSGTFFPLAVLLRHFFSPNHLTNSIHLLILFLCLCCSTCGQIIAFHIYTHRLEFSEMFNELSEINKRTELFLNSFSTRKQPGNKKPSLQKRSFEHNYHQLSVSNVKLLLSLFMEDKFSGVLYLLSVSTIIMGLMTSLMVIIGNDPVNQFLKNFCPTLVNFNSTFHFYYAFQVMNCICIFYSIL